MKQQLTADPSAAGQDSAFSQPLVTVCVPSFNNEETILSTVESILNQTYPNIEIIISDHGSTDRTREVLRPYLRDEKIRLVSFSEGVELCANWNFVTSLANGNYVSLVGADDLLAPTSVEVRVAALEKNPTAVMATSRRAVINPDAKVIIRRRGLPRMKGLISGNRAVRTSIRTGQNVFGEPHCVLFRTLSLQQAGLWSCDLPYVIDQATYFRLLARGDLYAIPEVLAFFRISKRQLSYKLLSKQATQVRSLHILAWKSHDFKVGVLDVMVGNLLCYVAMVMRRFTYWTLKEK